MFQTEERTAYDCSSAPHRRRIKLQRRQWRSGDDFLPYALSASRHGPNILFTQGGQNDLLTMDPSVWLTDFSAYLATFQAAIASSGKLVRFGVSTHNPRNDITFNAHRAVVDPALRLFPSQGKCDFVVDWAVDQTWGADSAALNQTLYPDILTERILRRPDRTIWRPIIFVPF